MDVSALTSYFTTAAVSFIPQMPVRVLRPRCLVPTSSFPLSLRVLHRHSQYFLSLICLFKFYLNTPVFRSTQSKWSWTFVLREQEDETLKGNQTLKETRLLSDVFFCQLGSVILTAGRQPRRTMFQLLYSFSRMPPPPFSLSLCFKSHASVSFN